MFIRIYSKDGIAVAQSGRNIRIDVFDAEDHICNEHFVKLQEATGDLISRSALKEELGRRLSILGMLTMNEIVDCVPAVEAEEVIHGTWVGEADGYAEGELVYDVWYCSECNFCIDNGTDDPELLPNYCENCGAKMKDEVTE